MPRQVDPPEPGEPKATETKTETTGSGANQEDVLDAKRLYAPCAGYAASRANRESRIMPNVTALRGQQGCAALMLWRGCGG
jgi:hypothetical protein